MIGRQLWKLINHTAKTLAQDETLEVVGDVFPRLVVLIEMVEWRISWEETVDW